MARISKTPRQKLQEASLNNQDIFGTLAPTENDSAFSDPKPQEKKQDGPDFGALMEAIGKLGARLDNQERSITAAYSTPAASHSTMVESTPKAVSFDDLPDPITDQKGFGEGLAARIAQQISGERQREQQQNQQQQRLNQQREDLWEDFQHDYSEYADNTDQVEFATRKVANRLTARGVDLDRYMVGNRDRFMQDIASTYDDIFGKPGDFEDEPKPQPRQQKRGRSQVTEDEEPQRTAGIFGGLESGGGRTSSKAKEEQGDMIKDLHAIQMKMGIF